MANAVGFQQNAPGQIPLSPTVQGVADAFGMKPVRVRDIVESILALHVADYAPGLHERIEPAWPAVSPARPISEWLTQIRTFFRLDAAPQLFGRVVILGAALADPTSGRAMEASGLFHQVALELKPPLYEAFTPEGRQAVVALPLAAAAGAVGPRTIRLGAPATPVALSGDSRHVAALIVDGTLRVVDSRRGALDWSIQAPTETQPTPNALARIWLNRDASSAILDRGPGTFLELLSSGGASDSIPTASGAVGWCCFSDDQTQLAVLRSDFVEIYSVSSRTLTQTLPLGIPGNHLMFSGALLLVSTQNSTVSLWELGTQLKPRASFNQPAIGRSTSMDRGNVLVAILSSSGTAMASGDDGGTICLWDAAGGSLLKSANHGAAVRALAFSEDGRFVASGGDDGFVNLWRVDEMLQVGRLGHGGAQIIDVAFDINGISLESIASDSVARRWELFTEPPIAPSYLTDYVPKQPAPSWIDDDVDAFARLIASRHMSPPLSIGIFGDWGSGKTFFMRSLQQRVARLAHDATQSGMAQRDIGYYKHIAQVEFNAWHYAGADLWASLVDNIFTKLWIGGDEQRAHARLEALFRESRMADTRAAHEASLEVALLRDQKAAAERRAKELEDKAAEVQKKREDLRAREKVAVERFEQSLSDAAREALAAAGFDELGQTAADVNTAIAKARERINRESFLITLATAADRRWRLFWLVAAIVGSLAVAFVITTLVPSSTVRDAVAPIAGVITFLSTVTVWVQKQYDWLKRQRTALALANTNDQEAEKHLAIEAASIDADLTFVKEDETRVSGELAIAHDRERTATERLEHREEEIRSGNPAALLARLIGDRAEGDFYREHLGLLALIRRDFEAISDFVEKDRLELEDEHLAPQVETAEDDARRINRIVLYIDDLDRCPPDVVVKVLEAIHLFLSFPMFVVVVGVDARWVSRALAIKYPDLLPEKPTPGEPAATPFDYLEKIFQVPYWIEPLGPDQTRQLVEVLLGRKLRMASGSIGPTAPSGVEASNALSGNGQLVTGDVGPEAQERGAARPEDLNARAMELTSKELECFDELAPLLGRSPRALKRFLNIYRLLRSKTYFEGFVEDRGPISDYRVVAFLLAVITSHPENAYALFSELLDDKLPARSLIDVAIAATRANPALEPIRLWLQLPTNAAWSGPVQPMRDWTREVMRYSFRPEPRSSEPVLASKP